MSLPNTYTNQNETNCCPIPNIDEWHEKEIIFENKPFIRMYTKSFMFMPINMGKVMTQINKTAQDAGATLPVNQTMILTSDLSPWKAEQLYAVSQPVNGADNIALSGTFLSKVYEGPYQNAKKWYTDIQEFAKSKGKKTDRVYFFYTTCPKCAKHYGKNYTIALVKIS